MRSYRNSATNLTEDVVPQLKRSDSYFDDQHSSLLMVQGQRPIALLGNFLINRICQRQDWSWRELPVILAPTQFQTSVRKEAAVEVISTSGSEAVKKKLRCRGVFFKSAISNVISKLREQSESKQRVIISSKASSTTKLFNSVFDQDADSRNKSLVKKVVLN